MDIPQDVLESQLYRRCIKEGIELVDGRYIYDQIIWMKVKANNARNIGDRFGRLTLVGVDVLLSGVSNYLRKDRRRPRYLHYIWKCDCGNKFTRTSRAIGTKTGSVACRKCSSIMNSRNFPIDVYMIHAQWCSAYKIGITTNIKKRLYTLDANFPVPVSLYYVRNGINKEQGIKLESELHRILQPYHLRHEWFKIPDKYVPVIKNIIKYAYGKVAEG